MECPNCSTPLSRRYCPQCGQNIGDINPTVHDLLHDVVHEFLHVDSKIFRTVKLLLKPGFLTREYFNGRRVRYVSPIRIYLVFSVIYFAASTLIERPTFRSDENVEVGALGAALGLEHMSPDEANELMADVQAHWIPRPQHLSFALHVHAAFFALLAATIVVDLLNVEWLNVVTSLFRTALLVTYTIVAFHRAYGGTLGLAVGRTAVVLTGYMLVSGVTTALSVVVYGVYAASH